MTQPFVGQLLYAGFNFAPFHYALCNGQVLPISQNSALFSLLGTFYGGNGTSTYALPNMQSRMPVHQGQGPGLSNYDLGEQTGVEHTTLTINNVPAHNHSVVASQNKATTIAPDQTSMLGRAVATTQLPLIYIPSTPTPATTNMSLQSIAATGGAQSFSILQPVLTVSCSIALFGIFPARN